MKVFEPNHVRVGEHNFHIWPFKAFTAANLSGDLMNLAVPLVAALLPMVNLKSGDDQEKSLFDIDIDAAGPAISGAFSAISGNRLETLLKKLLIVQENISVDVEEDSGKFHTEKLTEDLADEIFCGEVQDMYVLAFHVIRLNLNGFFKKLGTRFGGAAEKILEKLENLSGTDTST